MTYGKLSVANQYVGARITSTSCLAKDADARGCARSQPGYNSRPTLSGYRVCPPFRGLTDQETHLNPVQGKHLTFITRIIVC
jgi:hypothetical protein